MEERLMNYYESSFNCEESVDFREMLAERLENEKY